MSSFCHQVLHICLLVIWIMWKIAGWLFKFLDPPTGIPLNPGKLGEKMLFKQNSTTSWNEKPREDTEILIRLDRLTQESNKLLKILIGMRPQKEEGSKLDAVDNDTDMSEDDISEDESLMMVNLSLIMKLLNKVLLNQIF